MTDWSQKNCGNVSKMLQENSLQSDLKNNAQVHRGQKLLYMQRMFTPNVDLMLIKVNIR